MMNYQYAVLLIGLVFNILIIMFIIISMLLIYSLLMITTETKTFEFGVMRLVGLSKTGFVTMIMIQAVFFVIPSIIVAYICSIPSLYGIYQKILDTPIKFSVAVVPSAKATILAALVGILIPTFSAIIPIKRALDKSLNDSLNVARTQNSGQVVSITGGNKAKVLPYLFFGLLCVLVGCSIYVGLP